MIQRSTFCYTNISDFVYYHIYIRNVIARILDRIAKRIAIDKTHARNNCAVKGNNCSPEYICARVCDDFMRYEMRACNLALDSAIRDHCTL